MILHHTTSVHGFETVSGIVTELSGSFWLRLEVDGKEVLSVFGSPGQEKYLRDIADAINTVRSPSEEAEEPVNFRDRVQSTLAEQWGGR